MFLQKFLKTVKKISDTIAVAVVDLYKYWIKLEHYHEKGLEILQEFAEKGEADTFYINQIFMEPQERMLARYERLKPKMFVLGVVQENEAAKAIDKIMEKYTIKPGNPNGIFAKSIIKVRPLVLQIERNYTITNDPDDDKAWGEWRIKPRCVQDTDLEAQAS